MADAQKLKPILILVFLFFGQIAQAEWKAVLHRAGFLGKYALGVGYEFSPEHVLDVSIGVYQIENKDYYQSNVIYRYNRWNIDVDGSTWRPLQMGVFTIRSWDKEHYFVRSPSKYPYENYYDENALRWGLEFGTTYLINSYRIGFGYHFRILDSGLVAIYNNANRDLQYYIASGLSLQYLF